jgi:hypothetical protein
MAPFIKGFKYLSNIFFESLSTENKIDSRPEDWENTINGKNNKIKNIDLKFNY